jgi:hypothetical protein
MFQVISCLPTGEEEVFHPSTAFHWVGCSAPTRMVRGRNSVIHHDRHHSHIMIGLRGASINASNLNQNRTVSSVTTNGTACVSVRTQRDSQILSSRMEGLDSRTFGTDSKSELSPRKSASSTQPMSHTLKQLLELVSSIVFLLTVSPKTVLA